MRLVPSYISRWIPVLLAGGVLSAHVVSLDVPANVYLADPNDGHVTTVQLERLNGDGTRLDGRFVQVWSRQLNPDSSASKGIDGSSDFRYQPNTDLLQDCFWRIDECSLFDAVNVYYHIDRFATEYWINRLRVDIDFQAEAMVHFPLDGAVANAKEWKLTFGLGTTMMKNSALEDDVIYHEYAHLVTHALGFVVDVNSSVERAAMSEGYSHYFAASYTDDPQIGEWVVTCPPREHCVGPPNDTEMATLVTEAGFWNWNMGDPSDQLQYGSCTRYHPVDGKCKIGYHNFTDVYTWGMIWGSMLWDLRDALGQEVADRLILEGMLKLSLEDGFEEGSEALKIADRDVFGGSHLTQIEAVLKSRGFIPFKEELAGQSEVIKTEPSLRLDGQNPFSRSARFRVDVPHAGHFRVEIFDVLGRRIRILHDRFSPAGAYEFDWSPLSVPAGEYFCVLTSGYTRKSVAVTFIP